MEQSSKNFKQLTFAREYRGYSQTELASKIRGLSQSNLSKYEKGIGSLSDEVFDKIINFLNFPKSFFYERINIRIENAHYRKRTSVITQKNKSQMEYSFKIIGYIIDNMSDSVEYPEFSLRKIDIDEGYTIQEAVRYTRRTLGVKSGAVKDINLILENAGIVIVEVIDLPDGFDGISTYTDKGTPFIVLNKNMSNDRKRFTLAHELGHIILHSDTFLIGKNRDKEVEANLFASEFLMPEDEIKESLRGLKLSYLSELKRYWLTSMASIVRRAKDLNCITTDKYTYFYIELSRKGYKKEEPINVFIDSPHLFQDAYRMHIDDLDYTIEELSESFCIPTDMITRFTKNNRNNNLRILKNQVT